MFDATWKACVFSKDQSGAEFKSVVNPTAVVKSRAGKVIARVDKAERIRAFLGMVQSVECSYVSRKATRPSV